MTRHPLNSRAGVRETVREAARLNWVDRAIGVFSPRTVRDRVLLRTQLAIAGVWHGGSRSRNATKEFNPPTGSADADLIWDLDVMRDRSRALVRNSPLAGGAINTVVTNVVGMGIKARPKVNAKRLGMTPEEADAWEDAALEEWELFSESKECDITRTQDLAGLTSLVFRSVLECGDCFSLLPSVNRPGSPYRTKIQLIEADRVCNPWGQVQTDLFAGGVEMDSVGSPLAYHVLQHHPGSIFPQPRVWDRIPAFTPSGRRRILHHFDRQRVAQTRGFPYLAPVIEPLKQLGEYSDAEVMAAVVSSMFSVFVTTPDGEGLQQQAGVPSSSQLDPNSAVTLGAGSIIDLMPGEKIEVADPKRPNTAFDPFVQAILRQIGVRLELPFEVLIKHFTSSYTAARAALLEAWRFFKVRRVWVVGSFLAPIYEIWMDEAVATGRLDAPGYFADPLIRKAYLGCRWIGDAPGQIDPVKEISAAGMRMEEGISTLEEETITMTGGDWEENTDQQALELKRRKTAGLITEQTVGITGTPNRTIPPGQEGDGTDGDGTDDDTEDIGKGERRNAIG